MTVRVPKPKGAVFESAVIERYRRREESVEEALIDMHLAGVSTRRVDDTGQALWGGRMPSQTLSDRLKNVYVRIDQWRQRPLQRPYPYVFMDGVWHKRSWGGAVENVSVLVAIGVGLDGHPEVIGVAEGMKEDSASWNSFVSSLISRGLTGVCLVTGDRCAGLVDTVSGLLPQARYQRCMVHFMRNVLSRVSPRHTRWAADALKAIFAMESRESAPAKAEQVASEMEERKLREAAKCLREGINETTTYLPDDYPVEHRRRIRTNTMIRTVEPGDPTSNPRRGRVPRRQERVDARHLQDPIRHRQRLVHPALPGHVPAGRHHTGSELNTAPQAGKNQSAQEPGHYPRIRSFITSRPRKIIRLSVEHPVEDLGNLLRDHPIQLGLEQGLIHL
jgi:putative transposase